MADSKIAIKLTMGREKAYANSPTDRGGETNWGISKRQFPDLDIKSLTYDGACHIAKSCYWDKYRVGEIENQVIANYVFDMVFNMDYTIATLAIQIACRKFHPQIKIDGILGSRTISIINHVDSHRLLSALIFERATAYLRITDSNRTQRVNLASWIRRTLDDYEAIT